MAPRGDNFEEQFVGGSPIITLTISGVDVPMVADTGSQVTTISEEFYQEHLRSVLHAEPFANLRDFTVRAANGLSLPFTRYFVADVMCNGVKITDCGFLVTSNSSARAPGLLGTNIMERIPGYAEKLSELGASTVTPPVAKCGTSTLSFARVNSHGVSVPANTLTWIQLRGNVPESAIFESLTNLPTGLIIPDTYTERSTFHVAVFNTSSQEVWLKPQARLGILRPAVAVPRGLDVRCEAEEIVVTPKDGSQSVEDGSHSDASTTGRSFDAELAKVCENFPGTEEELQRFQSILKQYRQVFAESDLELGCVPGIKHRIPTTDDVPVQLPFRRIPPALMTEVRQHLDGLLKQGIIRESQSSYASPVVLVRKKDGKLRLCTDFRALNAKTTRDCHPIPRIQESLDSIRGARYFTSLDLKAAYNQIEVHEADVHKTAFTTPFGLFEHQRMAFGLKNAPACFQRLMNNVLRKELFQILLCYLDDILIYGRTVSEKLDRIETVFQRLVENGLKLDINKCFFFQRRVKYLGYEISEDGISTDPAKIDVVKKWPTPTTLKELRSVVGFMSYYRRYVPSFTQQARPLHKLIAELVKKFPGKRRAKNVQLAEYWTTECQAAFDSLKEALVTSPVLAYPRYGEPFILETDSSEFGLGAVLYQIQDGKRRIIAYGSRGLRRGETNKANYSSKKLELLALKWATEHFRDWLIGSHFTVYTDNNPLTYILQKKKLSALEQRWVNGLADFDFDIKFKSGATNVGADTLSRVLHRQEASMTSDEVDSCLLSVTNFTEMPPDLRLRIAEHGLDAVEADEPAPVPTAQCLPKMEAEDIAKLQREDEDIARLIYYRGLGHLPKTAERKAERPYAVKLLRQWGKYVERNGILYRKITDYRGDPVYQLVLPKRLHEEVLTALHDNAGHQGIERVEALVRARCYWPTMAADIEKHVKNCHRCNQSKMPYHRNKTPLGRLVAEKPLECIAMDFTILEKCDGRENVLVITDIFTKFTIAVPTRDQKAKTVAKILAREWFFRFGVPLRLHSDRGANFESDLIRELCKIFSIRKTSTTPYRPQSNSCCERFNRSLHELLRALPPDKKRRWPDHLPEVVHAYNTAPHASTRFSPFYLSTGENAGYQSIWY